MKNSIEILKSSKLFENVNESQILHLLNANTLKYGKYKRNDILFWTDDIPEKLYVLINGNIVMAKDTESGNRILSKSNNITGELIGEVRLFSDKQLLWDYAIALEDTEVLEIDSDLFLDPDIIDSKIQAILLKNIISIVVNKIDYLGQKVRILSMPSARQRIAFYLLSLQDNKNRIFLKSTREEIADYLGMARPSLSRELGKMQDEGIIKLDGQEVKIINQEAINNYFE